MRFTLEPLRGTDKAYRVVLDRLTVWFSYGVPVAFRLGAGPPVVRRNDWGTTTGRHINTAEQEAGGDSNLRVSSREFEYQLAAVIK